jgi:branched-subunit amino acid ABC-type transport system permease component
MPLDQLLLALRDHYATYHHHKEQMAYAAATLYLAAATGIAIKGPNLWQPCPSEIFRFKFVLVTTIVAYLFVAWQLRKREYAADMVQACGDLLVLGTAMRLVSPDLTPASHGEHLVPAVLKEKLQEIARGRPFLGGPRFSEALTYLVMFIWMIGALVRVMAACSLTSG